MQRQRRHRPLTDAQRAAILAKCIDFILTLPVTKANPTPTVADKEPSHPYDNQSNNQQRDQREHQL